MKNKRITMVTTVALITFIILALTLSTYAWYVDGLFNYRVELVADNIASMYFTSTDAEVEGTLVPAIAMEGAVENNKFMDVTREYNAYDAEPSWVSEVAGQITYWTDFVFRGNAPILITYESFISLADDPTYFIDKSQFITDVDFFVEEEELIQDDNKTTIYPNEETYITTVDVRVSIYFAYVDELVDPILKDKAIFTTIHITKVNQFEENQNIDISWDTDSIKSKGVMAPAVAMVGAVAEGKYMDVKRTYNASDPTPSWISIAATPKSNVSEVMYTGTNTYYVECSWSVSKGGVLLDPSLFIVEIVIKDANYQQLIPDENDLIALPPSSTITVEASIYFAFVEEVMQESYSHLLSGNLNILIHIKDGGIA